MNRINKADKNIWNKEVEKFIQACYEFGRVLPMTVVKSDFMGLKNYTWYVVNAPDELNITKYSEFI